MVKKSACFFFWIFLVSAALSVSCSAETFVDDCSSELSTLTRETYNLKNVSDILDSQEIPTVQDKSALAVQDYRQYGEMIYSVQNVEKITVSTYRWNYPTFALQAADEMPVYFTKIDSLEEYDIVPLWIDEKTDYLYCLYEGEYHLLYWEGEGNYYFLEEAQTFDRELMPYGISIEESIDGKVFVPVEVERTETKVSTNDISTLFDEIFSAMISPESKYVKIKMKQFSRMAYIENGIDGYVDVVNRNVAMIHEVSCEGDGADLNPGGGAQLPEGEPPEEEQQEEKDEKEESGSSKKSSSSSSSKSSGSTSTTTSTTTSTSTSESTSTTTTDSNNTTTTNNYTSNYFFINLPPEMEAALKQALGGEEETADDADLGGPSQADLGSTAQTTLTETEEVLYQDELTVGASDSAAAASVQPPQDSDEGEDRKLLYLLILLVSGVAVLEVMRILRTKGTPEDEPDDGSI